MTSERLTKPGSDEFISGMTREEMDAYYRKNERMLHSLLSKYAMPHGEADRDDMLQLAALGFFKGMATFDASLGVKMSTYCYQCAENEVVRGQLCPWRWRPAVPATGRDVMRAGA